ncbi:MAG: hypothetical protein U9Q62_06980 [Campylobacterota bacterium]|nr:hypothetical protein [Campylobacterota bacterium]
MIYSFFNYKAVPALILSMLLGSELFASQTYWFSDTPPTKEIAKKMRSSHDGLVQRSREGGTAKRLWLREGEDLVTSSYVKQNKTPLMLLDAKKSIKPIAFKNRGYAEAMFKMADEGYYNLFMISKHLDGDTLHISTAKKEALQHSCREGHDDVAQKIVANSYNDAPIDIIRERFPKENLHTHVTSGDVVSFTLLHYGKPLSGASVTMVTQKGWAKTLKSNAEGRVSFEMIRDYYPQWHEFKRRTRENFLIIAQYESSDFGLYKGDGFKSIHYKATAHGSYYPSTKDYKSYLYGLLIGLFGLFASGLAVYLYRRRRLNVYKEQRLD